VDLSDVAGSGCRVRVGLEQHEVSDGSGIRTNSDVSGGGTDADLASPPGEEH